MQLTDPQRRALVVAYLRYRLYLGCESPSRARRLVVLQPGDCRPQSVRGLVRCGLLVNGHGDYRLVPSALDMAHGLWLSGRFTHDGLVAALHDELYGPNVVTAARACPSTCRVCMYTVCEYSVSRE